MTSRKVLKKKRHCLEFSKERWSIPSKKDFACQVENNFKQPVHVQTTATQTDLVLPAPSSEVSGINQDGGFALHTDKLHDFCVNFTSAEEQDARKCGSLTEKFIENRAIHKVVSVFESKNHKLDKLTSKNLSLSSHRRFGFRLLKLCEMLFQKANAVPGCGKSGQFSFKKETEPQTGILKLEFICFECEKLFSNYLATARLFLPVRNQSAHLTNYVLLAFTCGLYFKVYDPLMGTLGISHFSKKQ